MVLICRTTINKHNNKYTLYYKFMYPVDKMKKNLFVI